MWVVMQLSERLEIWTGCTVSIVTWKSKIIFSRKLYQEGLISIIMHNYAFFTVFLPRDEAEISHEALER